MQRVILWWWKLATNHNNMRFFDSQEGHARLFSSRKKFMYLLSSTFFCIKYTIVQNPKKLMTFFHLYRTLIEVNNHGSLANTFCLRTLFQRNSSFRTNLTFSQPSSRVVLWSIFHTYNINNTNKTIKMSSFSMSRPIRNNVNELLYIKWRLW